MTTLSPSTRITLRSLLAIGLAAVSLPPAASGQWSTTYEQFYLPGSFNWHFRRNYPSAERLFNAFDYGHAILYEKLWTQPTGARSDLEERQYDFITKDLLVHPPNVALEEAAIEVAYAKLAPEAKAMFDWAHLLHRQIYDVWSDESMTDVQRDAMVQRLIAYYRSRPDLAFSSKPKTMELMEGQPYSTAFRRDYPKFNGLIWAYHWLQVGLYEPLVTGTTNAEKQAGVGATVARFRQMLTDPPRSMPYLMPMTAAIAPEFAKRYPEAAIIFDNLHSMHDVVSDILANPSVPRDQKRAEIVKAGRRYRDATSYVQSVAEWREMTGMMGVENMGGPAVGFLPALPTPTVERGAVMASMNHETMPGMRMKVPAGAGDSTSKRADDMAGMAHGAIPGMAGDRTAAPAVASGEQMMALQMRMLEDPLIRTRVLADTAMRRMLGVMMQQMPAEHRAHMEMLLHETPADSVPASMHSPDSRGAGAKAVQGRRTKGTRAPRKRPMNAMPGMDHDSVSATKKKP